MVGADVNDMGVAPLLGPCAGLVGLAAWVLGRSAPASRVLRGAAGVLVAPVLVVALPVLILGVGLAWFLRVWVRDRGDDGLAPGSRYEYRVYHSRTIPTSSDHGRSETYSNASAGRLERRAAEPAVAHEVCDHCGARLVVTLPPAVEVGRERRRHRVLWKVYALATAASGYGVVQVVRTSRESGAGPLVFFALAVGAVLFFLHRTFLSLLRSRAEGPGVYRLGGAEPDYEGHSVTWTALDAAAPSDAVPVPCGEPGESA